MLNNKKWAIAVALVVAVLVTLLPACAPETVVVTEEVEVPVEVTKIVEVEKPVEVEVEVTAVPEPPGPEELARAQTLNIAVSKPYAAPDNLNVYAGADRSRSGIHQVVYEYFFYENLQTGEYIPWLAEGYEYNDDFTAITVNLRDGVEWSDGEPFTPEDVVFTYDTLLANPAMTWAAEVSKWTESVEKLDDLTVRFNLTAANPRYHVNREAFPAVGIWGGITILPQHVWEGLDPLTFKNSDPIGTGPYTLVTASGSAITWERRDDWWGTKVFGVTPAPKIMTFQYVGSPTSVALALAANEIDTPQIGILALGDFLAVADRNPNVSAWHKDAPYTWLDPCPRALMVQNDNPPWDQKEMRWALSYLINWQSVVDLAYEGSTVPAWGIWPAYDGMNPYFDAIQDLREQYPTATYDSAKAEEILTSAGYQKGSDGYWASAAGEKLHLNFLVNAGDPEAMKVTTIVADQLEAGGIEVEVQPLSGSVQENARLLGEYDLAFQPFCPGYIFDNLELFHSKYYVDLGEMAPWYERNSFRFQNEAFDAVVDEMAATPPYEVEKVKDQFQRAMAIWLDELPVIPGVQAPALVPFNSTYWEGWPSADDPWNMPVSWWASWNLVVNGYPSPTTGEWVGGIRPAGQ
ncbi:MAG: ABC transporter substrate-binding protein [Chloroflexi bacterium]|nr:ABC transporter substrate-binding protein [Chloroflexota bacterium]